MKRAVSISIGTSKRDKEIEIELLGEKIIIERRGTNGDMEKAALLYKELDGKVDAFGVGGADLGVMVDQKWYPLYSVHKMVRFIEKTPVVDGEGLKNTLEKRLASFIDSQIGDYIAEHGKKSLRQRRGGSLGDDKIFPRCRIRVCVRGSDVRSRHPHPHPNRAFS